jgi:pimeloyl-ACP methyl ester carboxylesterase
VRWYFYPYYFVNDIWLVFRNRFLYYFSPNPPKKWKNGDKGDVVLIPGANAWWISLKKIAKSIYKKGYRVHFVKKLKNNSKLVLSGVADVAEYIKTNNLNDVILIGHSKGAIIAICLLKNPEINKKIKKVIDIAGPLRGTLLSRIYPSTKELQPSSELIKHFSEGIDMKKVISIYPKIDDMIIPNESLVGENFENRQINVFGHIRIIETEEIIHKLSSILASLN